MFRFYCVAWNSVFLDQVSIQNKHPLILSSSALTTGKLQKERFLIALSLVQLSFFHINQYCLIEIKYVSNMLNLKFPNSHIRKAK